MRTVTVVLPLPREKAPEDALEDALKDALEDALAWIRPLSITAFVLVASTCGWLAASACPIIIVPLAVTLVPLASIVWIARPRHQNVQDKERHQDEERQDVLDEDQQTVLKKRLIAIERRMRENVECFQER